MPVMGAPTRAGVLPRTVSVERWLCDELLVGGRSGKASEGGRPTKTSAEIEPFPFNSTSLTESNPY